MPFVRFRISSHYGNYLKLNLVGACSSFRYLSFFLYRFQVLLIYIVPLCWDVKRQNKTFLYTCCTIQLLVWTPKYLSYWYIYEGKGGMENGSWVVSRGLRLTDCFVWLTKQRRNIYSVAESCLAVNCQDPSSREDNHLQPGTLGDYLVMGNGRWSMANGLMELGRYPAIRSPAAQHQQELFPALSPGSRDNGT